VTSTRERTVGLGEKALRELIASGEIESDWCVAHETIEASGSTKVYRIWFEKQDRSDSFSVRLAIGVKASPEETEAAAVEEVKRLIRVRRP
jgi:hypothetical protein